MYICSSDLNCCLSCFKALVFFHKYLNFPYFSQQLEALKCSNAQTSVTRLVWSLAAALRFIGVTGLRGLTCSNPDRPDPLLLNQPLRQMVQEVGREGWPMKKLAFYHWPMMLPSLASLQKLVHLYLCLWLWWQRGKWVHNFPEITHPQADKDRNLDHHCGQTETKTGVSLCVLVA